MTNSQIDLFEIAGQGALVKIDQYNQLKAIAMDWLPVETALETLGVQRQTLYAYVSRGLVRARPDEDDPRRSLYAAGDIRSLKGRRRGARRRSEVAHGAIAWGEPVLDSSISTVRDGDLILRGRSIQKLAERATLEDVARLLWNEPATTSPTTATTTSPTTGTTTSATVTPFRQRYPTPKRGTDSAKSRAFLYLAHHAANDPPSLGRSPATLRADAWALLSGFCDALAGEAGEGKLHHRLAASFGAKGKAVDLIRRALVLMSDHELNASTFAVRIAASTGAPLAACALAGLSTLAGPLHGEAAARSLAQLDQVLAAPDPAAHARAMVARGEPLSGFAHPLYPDGDVRAQNLLAALKPRAKIAAALKAIQQSGGEPPNCDAALAAMTRELDLPPDAMFSIFALARLTGWLAHAMEQRETGRLIRPRARYVGE